MKILNILTLSSIVAPALAMPFTTNGHNVASANRKMTVAEANSDLELLTNPNLQLKKLMNSSGEFNALSLNKDYAENQLFPNHKLYQYFFRDRNEDNKSWKVIQKQELNITNQTFKESLKKNENGFYILPIFSKNTKISEKELKDLTLEEIRRSNLVCNISTDVQSGLTGFNQNPAATNDYVKWFFGWGGGSAVNWTWARATMKNFSGFKDQGEWESTRSYDQPSSWQQATKHNGKYVVDHNTWTGEQYLDLGSIIFGDDFKSRRTPRKDGTNYTWDWNANFINSMIDNETSNDSESNVLGMISYDTPTTKLQYEKLVDTSKTQSNYIYMNNGWLPEIFGTNILGSDSCAKYGVANQFTDTAGVFNSKNGLWNGIIPNEAVAIAWGNNQSNPACYGGAFTGYRPEDANRSWAKTLYFDINSLIETNWIGKDSEKGYYTSADLNKEISQALLGILYQKQFIENIVEQDWSTLKSPTEFNYKTFPELKLNNCFYFNDVLGQSNFGGGIKTWLGWDNQTGKCAVEESTKWKIEDFIPALWSLKQNILKLVSNMKPSTNVSGEENIYLTYQNYFTFKNWVNKYVREHINADTVLDVLPIDSNFYLKELQNGYKDKSGETEVEHKPACIDYNNPFTNVQKYKFGKYLDTQEQTGWGKNFDFDLSINNLKTLILILPQLQLSEWSMVGRQDTTTDDVTIDFDNAAQNANVGKHKFEGDISYSSGTEMLEPLWNSSNIFPIKAEYAADDTHDMIISTNIQTSTNFSKNIGTCDSTVVDEGATTTHKAGTIQNIAELAAKTDGAISVGPEVKYTYGTETHNLNETIRVKKNAKIIENVKNCELLGVPYHVSVKEDLLAHQSDVIWQRALRDNSNDTIKALKSIYQCQNTETKEVSQGLPFVECDLFNDLKTTFDLSSLGTNRYLKVVPDATKGTLTTYLMYKDPETNDETVIDEYVSKGFATNNPEPIDPTGDKINVGAIVGGTVGGVVLAGGIAAGSVLGVRHAKLKKKEKDFDAEVKEEENK